MSSNTKERLLHDLEALRHQLAEIEAYGTAREGEVPAAVNIPTLETDNIPLLGDAVPADREEAIAAHRAAMAQLDAELKELDKKESTNIAANSSEHQTTAIASKNTANGAAVPQVNKPAQTKNARPAVKPATSKPQIAATAKAPTLQPANQPTFVFEGIVPTMTAPKPTTAADDNPFLPAHLRERLNKSKSSLLEEIARSSESLDASTALLRNFGQGGQAVQPARPQNADAHYQDILDTLVAKYLPLIEADLRQRLGTALAQQMAAQKKPEHSH